MTYENRFAGRRAVVTGGSSGIGLAIARRLLAEGAIVTSWDIAPPPEGSGLTHAQVDVTDMNAVQSAADTARADVLICSAGITGPNAPTWDYPADAWQKVFDLNVNGVYNCVRAVVPAMRDAGFGRIVTIASVAGKEGNPNAPAYSASKAAVIGLMKTLGKELAQTGVTANAVAPGAVETPIFDQMTQAHIDFMKSKIPMGRFGTVDEIAAMACWLASDEASFTTGAVFDQSGGRATY
ncbi:3-oxoacyl-ACP reductase [Actibacterium mucosum KCTC 23349]|uniref:3-oxoacyl-ACP reductase n=1 Tax=Actibacterium mucosum KCTC 23349 TaxID=1454373 RepID=A0A037ZHG6_9RHOB|nr:SDR family NAD(P)-dependent oxidoreductase [Actibacterium mucosum]KAJ54967.1 3-oxoacyl-ACP reductase [Actibacterium mucosum KCTC 23349]